jgi:hypothetical protein
VLREKSHRDDPRKPFYVAMRANRTHEGYFGRSGRMLVEVLGYKQNRISGRMEILYCHRKG